MRKLSQRGDTIVEVLICIAVVSVILTGAFVTTHRSQQGVRDSQEHAQALKLLESQLEQIRSNATAASPAVFTTGTPFCMYNLVPVSTGGATAANCVVNAAGVPTTAEPKYNLSVSRTSSGASAYIFTIQATWNSVTGKVTAKETISYRLYN